MGGRLVPSGSQGGEEAGEAAREENTTEEEEQTEAGEKEEDAEEEGGEEHDQEECEEADENHEEEDGEEEEGLTGEPGPSASCARGSTRRDRLPMRCGAPRLGPEELTDRPCMPTPLPLSSADPSMLL